MFSELLVQFRQEVEILKILNHPHIVRLYEVFESESTLHVVTEYVQGGELFDYLVERPDRLLSEAETSGIVRQVAWALAYMHKEGVMHRDLKLENILVASKPADDEEYPNIKLIDFGLAKRHVANTSSASAATVTEDDMLARPTANTFFGTVGYIAPEMIKRKGYTAQVDNWALGVLTYVLLCGVFPFDDDPTSVSMTRKPADYSIKFPPWANKISDSAKDLLKKLLDVDPNRRLTAGKALQHPWVAGETASKNAVLGTPKLLEELRIKNMYGVRGTAARSISLSLAQAVNLEDGEVGDDHLNLDGDLFKGSVSPLTLDEHTRKSLNELR